MESSNSDNETQNISHCPYHKAKNYISNIFTNKSTISQTSTSSPLSIPKQGKCPFGFDTQPTPSNIITPESNEDQDDDTDTTEPPKCPVVGITRKDCENKHFSPFYEIPCYDPYDCLFHIKGTLTDEEFAQKTKLLRSLPRHLKNTLFYQGESKLSHVHQFEFPKVYMIYYDVKMKGLRYLKRKQYKKAIDYFTYTYGLLKWIEFKPKPSKIENLHSAPPPTSSIEQTLPKIEPILDDDIVIKEVIIDNPEAETDTNEASIVFILEMLAYAHMEIREYSPALECMDEAIKIAGDKRANCYFRRSQIRTYNKCSSDEELKLAMDDINKAIMLDKTNDVMYIEHKEILEKIIEKRYKDKLEKIRNIIYKSKLKIEYHNDLGVERDEMFLMEKEDADNQFLIFNEMKYKYDMAVKYFYEKKISNEIIDEVYQEYEEFHKTYEEFIFFYKFKINNIDPKVRNDLTLDEQNIINNSNNIDYINDYCYKLCERVISEGKLNEELFQQASEKVFSELMKTEEKANSIQTTNSQSTSNILNEFIMNISKHNQLKYISICFVIFSIIALVSHYIMYKPTI